MRIHTVRPDAELRRSIEACPELAEACPELAEGGVPGFDKLSPNGPGIVFP